MELDQETFLKEISLSFVNQDVTFLVGTGFSRFLTNNKIPSWVELLYEVVKKAEGFESSNKNTLNNILFTEDIEGQIRISENLNEIMAAQLLEDAFENFGLNIRKAIAEVIKEHSETSIIDQDNLRILKDFFHEYYPISKSISKNPMGQKNINIFTTNYDEIIEKYIFEKQANVFSNAAHKKTNYVNHPNIYHIHGEVNNYETIIVTLDDYYKFQSKENYLTRKLYSLIAEETTIILGYSLGDFNINKILNEANYEKNKYLNNNKIFYIVREKIDKTMKQYYKSSFGIHVLDNMEIDDFFIKVIESKKFAEKYKEEMYFTYESLNKDSDYSEESLKMQDTFQVVLERLHYLGNDLNSVDVIGHLLSKLLNEKKRLTKTDGAFEQYEGLASWLILFLKNVEWKQLSPNHKKEVLDLIKYSFSKMSKSLTYGYSWNAFRVWKNSWNNIPREIQANILEFVEENSHYFESTNKLEDIIGEYKKIN